MYLATAGIPARSLLSKVLIYLYLLNTGNSFAQDVSIFAVYYEKLLPNMSVLSHYQVALLSAKNDISNLNVM